MIKTGSFENEQANLYKAEGYKAEGNKAFTAGCYEEAVENFTKAICCNPQDHTYYTNRSVCYYKLKRYAESLEDANKSVEINPNWVKGYWRKGLAEFCLGLYNQSENSLRLGLKLNPDNDQFEKFVKYMKTLQFLPQEADILNQMISSISSSNVNMHNTLKDSVLQSKLLSLRESPENLVSVIESDPKVEESLNFLVTYESLNTDNVMEEQKIESYAEINDQGGLGHGDGSDFEKSSYKNKDAKTAGNEAYKRKAFQLALKYYDEALEVDPKDCLTFNNKAAVYLELKNYKRALEEVERALEVYQERAPDISKLAKILHRKANIFTAMQDYDKAIEFYKKSLMENLDPHAKADLAKAQLLKKKAEEKKYINPDIADQQKEKADELLEKGEIVAALKEYEEALKRNPQYAVLYYRKAVCLSKLLEIPAALKEIDKSTELDPFSVDAWILKGSLHELMKEYHKARASYSEGLKIDPTNEKCQKKLQGL